VAGAAAGHSRGVNTARGDHEHPDPIPSGLARATFYSYAYPVPAGFGNAEAQPAEAHFHETLGEVLLPYDAVRTAVDPDAALLAFLQSTYEAAADLAGWDRASLEREPIPPI